MVRPEGADILEGVLERLEGVEDDASDDEDGLEGIGMLVGVIDEGSDISIGDGKGIDGSDMDSVIDSVIGVSLSNDDMDDALGRMKDVSNEVSWPS